MVGGLQPQAVRSPGAPILAYTICISRLRLILNVNSHKREVRTKRRPAAGECILRTGMPGERPANAYRVPPERTASFLDAKSESVATFLS
jgi:hypothetical protein